jgi:outer membrane protein OmpA-like peptidoglycan-associated protein
LSGVEIKILDDSGNILKSLTSNDKEEYEFTAEADKEFTVITEKENYFGSKEKISTRTDSDEISKDLILEENPGSSLLFMAIDADTKEVLKDIKISVVDNKSGRFNENVKGADNLRIVLPDKKPGEKLSYQVKLEKEGYLSKTVTFNYTIKENGEIIVHEKLDLTMSKLKVGGDLAKLINLKPIYFNLGKSDIRKDAAIELDKIVKILNEYPSMIIEIGSHTDCRSSAEFNAKLSENRAISSVEYIRKRITDPERVLGKGYGESRLKNDCSCEGQVKSNCTEEQHQENRRTEFIIIKFE